MNGRVLLFDSLNMSRASSLARWIFCTLEMGYWMANSENAADAPASKMKLDLRILVSRVASNRINSGSNIGSSMLANLKSFLLNDNLISRNRLINRYVKLYPWVFTASNVEK